MRWTGVRVQRGPGERRSKRWLLAAPAALIGVLLALVSAAAGSPGVIKVAAAPRVPRGAKAAGAVSSSATVSGAVVLKPRDNAALTRFIANVTNRHSAQYGHYLPTGAFASRFGPTQASTDAVRAQLQSDGLRVTSVSSNGLLMHFSGSAAKAEAAFHTGLTRYRLADGSTGQATTSAIQVPSTIAPSVAAVVGLNDLVHLRPSQVLHGSASGRARFGAAKRATFSHPSGSPTPCADASQASIVNGGLTDDQIGNAYGAFGLYGAGDFGSGQRVAIFELEPFALSDLKTFDTCYFGSTQATNMINRVKVVPVDGGQPSGPGSGESILDVEDVSALAPGANIDVYEAPNTNFGSIDEYAAIINANQDRAISTSWGLCEQALQEGEPGDQQAENLLFEQAAAQGQTVFASAGDEGSDDCDAFELPSPVDGQNPVSVDDPGSQPYVVGVGGTTLNDASSQPPQEQVWNDGSVWGATGGGISQSWVMPSWQRSALVPGISMPGGADYTNANSVEQSFGYSPNFCQGTVSGASSTTACRLVPDVAAQGDQFTGAITVFSTSFEAFSPNGWTTIGGTSSSTPLWAAMLADINVSSTCKANSKTAAGVGFASPLLYAVASNPGDYAASFNDITSGNNDIFGLNNGLVFPARAGYDPATGLGSPQLTGAGGTAGLAFYLCSFAAQTSRPVISSLSPTSGSTVGGEVVTVTGSGFEAGGKPVVAAVQVGTRRVSATNFHVISATSLTVTMPAAAGTRAPSSPAPQDGSGAIPVVVSLTNGQTSAPGASSTFQYVATAGGRTVPSVSGITPYGGLGSAPAKVTILGSGFTGATTVQFGGVAASSFTVVSPNRITATPPARSSGTNCVPLPTTGVYKGENANNDICQVYVKVTNANGTSATGKILPPPEGPINFGPDGALQPPGCSCEIAAAPAEYDYVPVPTVTSVSTSSGPGSLASEDPDNPTVITIKGTGLNYLTMAWADFGDPSLESSQNTDYVFLTGTEMQIVAPPEGPSVDVLNVPFSVKTLAGQSTARNAQYAGVPTVSGVVNTTSSTTLNGIYGGPDTGRTPITINGQGFSGQLLAPLQFADSTGGPSLGTQYTFTVNGDTSVSTQTVAQNPALVDVQACTVSGCSLNPPADEFYLYPPGNPKVESISPTSGPAAGGTSTQISGENLGCPLQVFFGNKLAETFSSVETFLDCGSTQALTATSPAGAVGTVPVTVTTVESYFTGSGRSTTTANFTYK